MTHNAYSMLRNTLTIAATLLVVGLSTNAMAVPQPMDSSELADVTGGDGISISMDLHLNAKHVARSFNVDGVTTYATMNDVGGDMLALGITVDVKTVPGGAGQTYVDVGMPGFVAFNKFGFKTSGVQTDLNATLPATQNLGGVNLHGTGAMTGHFLIWAK